MFVALSGLFFTFYFIIIVVFYYYYYLFIYLFFHFIFFLNPIACCSKVVNVMRIIQLSTNTLE